MATSYRAPGSTDFSASAYWLVAGVGTALASNQDLRLDVGADSFATGMNQAAKDFLSVYFENTWGDQSTTIGSSGSPLLFDCDQTSTGKIKFTGQCRELNLGVGSGTAIHNELIWAPRNGAARLNYGSTGVCNRFIQESGISTINSGIDIGSGGLNLQGGTCTIEAHASDVPAIVVMGGTLVLRRDWTSLKIGGTGLVILDLDSTAGVAGGTIELDGEGATLLIYQGNFSTLTGYAGRYDKSKLKRAVTTSGAVELYSRMTEVLARDTLTDVTENSRTVRGTGPKKLPAGS